MAAGSLSQLQQGSHERRPSRGAEAAVSFQEKEKSGRTARDTARAFLTTEALQQLYRDIRRLRRGAENQDWC